MPFAIPPDLHADLVPLAFLLGRWSGRGRGEYPGDQPFEFGAELTLSADARPFASYAFHSWELDSAGAAVRPLEVEYGFWRMAPDRRVEVVLAQPIGQAEVWYGEVDGAKVEIATDAVVRTHGATDAYSAGHRLYGLVEGKLMWAFDKATDTQPMASYTWATLERT